MNSKNIKIIDFAGCLKSDTTDAYSCDRFSESVTDTVRNRSASKVLVVVDRGFGMKGVAPHLVSDHLNLTGSNPLMGPNNPCGERFPVVNGIYDDCPAGEQLAKLPRGILGGLKEGIVPTKAEEEKLRSLGAEFFSYNLVQTMIIAAHAGLKVIGLVVPKDAVLDASLVAEIEAVGN